MTDSAKALRDLALSVTRGDLRRPWSVQTSNSFRRIGTDRGDGDVLCAITQHPDGHPDLHAAPDVLDYIVAAHPLAILQLLHERDAARHALHLALHLVRHKISGHAHAFQEASQMAGIPLVDEPARASWEGAVAIVQHILADLIDRRGLRQAWEGIDDGIRCEIVKSWVKIAEDLISEVTEAPPPVNAGASTEAASTEHPVNGETSVKAPSTEGSVNGGASVEAPLTEGPVNETAGAIQRSSAWWDEHTEVRLVVTHLNKHGVRVLFWMPDRGVPMIAKTPEHAEQQLTFARSRWPEEVFEVHAVRFWRDLNGEPRDPVHTLIDEGPLGADTSSFESPASTEAVSTEHSMNVDPSTPTEHPPISSYGLGQLVTFYPGRGDWCPGIVTRLESGLRRDRSAWHMIFISSSQGLPNEEWTSVGAYEFTERDITRVKPRRG